MQKLNLQKERDSLASLSKINIGSDDKFREKVNQIDSLIKGWVDRFK